jgi:O-methyltransferase domain
VQTDDGALDDALGMEVYAYLQQYRADAAVFDAAMSSVSGQEAAALRDAYDFSRFGTLVDVGGGRGLVLASLRDAYRAFRVFYSSCRR